MSCSHGRQSTPSRAPEVNTAGCLLTIGELARRADVTASALRYYEELGLLPAPARISGQRRYPESAARLVAAILLFSDAGFTLAEQKALLAAGDDTPGDRRQLMQRKLAELDEQIAYTAGRVRGPGRPRRPGAAGQGPGSGPSGGVPVLDTGTRRSSWPTAPARRTGRNGGCSRGS